MRKKTRPLGVGLQAATSYEEIKKCNIDTFKAWLGENKILVDGKKK